MVKSFSECGFSIIKGAISHELLEQIQSDIYNLLNNSKKHPIDHNKIYSNICKHLENTQLTEFEYVKPIFEFLFYKKYIDSILLEKKLFNSLSSLLGKDLAFSFDPHLTLNLPTKLSPETNYLFKDWHQEIWSGANISTLQIWTPLFQHDSKQGQLEIIIDSHKWGHIPHRNRKPVELPKDYKTKIISLEYGDAIIFSTLTVHRTSKAEFPRLALPVLVRNFKYRDNSFQDNRNWKIFSYSELTKIERILGNHYLSPFRLIDIGDNATDLITGTIKT